MKKNATDRKTQYRQDFSNAQLDLQIQCNLSKNPRKLFYEYQRTDSKVYMEKEKGDAEEPT